MVLQSGDGGIGSLLSNYGLLMVMIIVIWLFFLRPQAKKQKNQAKFIEEITKGDEIVTNSGMLGRVNKIEDNIVTLQIDTKTFVRVTKGSISRELTEAISKGKDA